MGGASVVENSPKRLIGDAGTGKSHLLTRAAKQTKSEDPDAKMTSSLVDVM